MSNKMSKVLVGALFALLIVISFTMCLSSDVFTAYAYDKTNDYAVENTISTHKEANGLTNVHWENKTKTLSDKDIQLFEEYGIDGDEALSATDVYVQEEIVEFEEVIPKSMIPDDVILPANIGDSQTTEEIHNKGYIKFTTKAYALGFYDGGIVYHIEETVHQLKPFFMHNVDNLIIRHGSSSQTFNHENFKAHGSISNPYTIRYLTGEVEHGNDYFELSPEVSVNGAGIYYSFRVGGYNIYDPFYTLTFANSTIKGDYYLRVTDTTEVQPVYVYNRSSFIDSLSINFGIIGVGIDIDDAEIMSGTSMLLKGYKDRIQTSVHVVQPSDYGFEPQYFFYEKTASHNVNGLAFDTKRLRTGYIEEQYVNLSPNRNGAGLAYLEFDFQVPIYEMSVYLSYWSASERYTLGEDSAYLQYMDKNGNWVTLFDMLRGHLPTDRNNQKRYEFNIVEGAQKIRFIATKVNQNSDRNKGRICIGEIKFVNWTVV